MMKVVDMLRRILWLNEMLANNEKKKSKNFLNIQ